METLSLEEGSCAIGCAPSYKVSTTIAVFAAFTLFPPPCDGRFWMNLENARRGGGVGLPGPKRRRELQIHLHQHMVPA